MANDTSKPDWLDEGLVPIDSDPIIPGQSMPAPPPPIPQRASYLDATLPLSVQFGADLKPQGHNNVPNTRLFPVQAAGDAGINSANQSGIAGTIKTSGIVQYSGSQLSVGSISGGSTSSLSLAMKGDVTGTNDANTVVSTHLTNPLPVAQGGSGTATPAIVAGTSIGVSGSWPDQTINNTSAYASLADPLPVAHGGTGLTAPALVAGTNITISGSWPNQTINASGGGTGALVPLEQHTASGSAELDFTTWESSSYDDYLVEVLDFNAATDGAYPMLQFSTDGGSTWDTTTNYGWAHRNIALNTGTVGQNYQYGVDSIVLFASSTGVGLLGTATPGLACSFKMRNPANASNYTFLDGEGTAQFSTNSDFYNFSFSGLYHLQNAVNAFRILMSSGNIASGTIRVYGIAKS